MRRASATVFLCLLSLLVGGPSWARAEANVQSVALSVDQHEGTFLTRSGAKVSEGQKEHCDFDCVGDGRQTPITLVLCFPVSSDTAQPSAAHEIASGSSYDARAPPAL